jgi:hypothetical protein
MRFERLNALTSTNADISKRVQDVFDLDCSRADQAIRCGDYDVLLQFLSRDLESQFLESLIPYPSDRGNALIRFVSRRDIDLDDLVDVLTRQTQTYISDEHFMLWHASPPGVLYIFDVLSRRGVVWLADDEAPAWELSRPACPIIQAILTPTPWLAVHGAAISQHGRTFLLAGKGKAGKSTAALACASAGWDYAGDDYFLADSSTGMIQPIYASGRLRDDIAPAFRGILPSAAHISVDDNEKRHELRLKSFLSRERIRGGKLTAILLPRRRGADTPKFEIARASDAFNALFSTIVVGAPLRAIAAKLTALISGVPCHFVDTGSSPAKIPDAFAEFLRSSP